MASRPRRVNRAVFGTASGDLGDFAAPAEPEVARKEPLTAVPEPVQEPEPAPAPEPEPTAAQADQSGGDDDTEDNAPIPKLRRRPAPGIVRKNFPMEKAFIDELTTSRKKWHLDDLSRFDHFNGGMASENAFLQAVARLGMERLERNAKDADRLLKLFPANTRGR